MKKSPTKSTLKNALYKNPSAPAEERAKDLISRMTLREKIGQLNQLPSRMNDDELRPLISPPQCLISAVGHTTCYRAFSWLFMLAATAAASTADPSSVKWTSFGFCNSAHLGAMRE